MWFFWEILDEDIRLVFENAYVRVLTFVKLNKRGRGYFRLVSRKCMEFSSNKLLTWLFLKSICG